MRYPLIEEIFTILARHEASDLVAHHCFQVMSKTRDRKDVLQLRRKPRVGIRRIKVILLRLLRRLRAEESRIVCILAMDERDETKIRKLFLAPVSDGNFRRALERDFAFIRSE